MTAQLQSKIVTEMCSRLMQDPSGLREILRDGFDGVNNMDERDLHRYAMMHGLIDEDAGEDR